MEKYPPTLIIDFDHGWATDLIPQVRQLTHFTRMENLLYESDKGVRKVGGSARINSTAISGSPDILGMYDYWITGTGGSFTQKYMAVTSNSKIYKEDMDGVFDDITGGATITANAIPVFCVFNDLLTIWFSTNDTPLSWNGTDASVSSLAGSPPAGRGAVVHGNRLWTWGANANPSRISYSPYGDPTIWSGTDTGFLDIAVNDGDRIIGAVSYKGNLIIFKGPNKGSIHPIEGLTPGDFTASPNIIRGIALQSHNSIISVGDDIWYMSRRGIHSLQATFAQGNYAEADLSRYQKKFFRDTVKLTQLARVWSVNYATKNCALWTLTQSGQTDPTLIFGLSYINPQKLKPFSWTNRSCFSAATRIHPTSGLEEIIFGTTDGFCEREDTLNRGLANGSSYPMVIETPQIILAPPEPRGDQEVTLVRAYLKSQPVGNYNVVLDITRDNHSSDIYTFNQGNPGFLLGTSVLGIDSLSENIATTVPRNISGSARSARFTLKQNGFNEDAHLYELGIDYGPSSTTMEAS